MLKSILTLGLVAVIVVSNGQSLAENQNFTLSPVFQVQPEFASPMPPPMATSKKKKVGRALTVLGGVLIVGGVALVSTADELYYNYNNTNGNSTESGDPKGALGVVMIAGGLGAAIPGIILLSKAKKQSGGRAATLHLNGNSVAMRFTF